MVSDAQQQFAAFMKKEQLAWPDSKTHVLYGGLLDELNEFIGKHQIDLVVIGSSTREGTSRLLLGSMAEYLFRSLRAPVLVMGPQVREPLRPGHPIHHILLCESLVPEAASAMTYGCNLAKGVAASVTVMHVLPASLKDSPRALQFQRMFEDELRVGSRAKDSFPQADYIVTFGDTAREIVRVANSVHADVIVLGAKPAEMWQTHLGRGTAFRVVGDAHCPILSVCACYGAS
jgi:nucleotide-binding universal stress UspA family protein